MNARVSSLILAAVGMLPLVFFAPFLYLGAAIEINDPATRSSTYRRIGPVEQAQTKIKVGMTKEEVRSLFGLPHQQEKDEWEYFETETLFGGSGLRVHFGRDGLVTKSEQFEGGW